MSFLNIPMNRQWVLLMAFNHEGLALAAVWFSTTLVFNAHGSGGIPLLKPYVLPVTHEHMPFSDIVGVAGDDPTVDSGTAAATKLPDEHLWEPTCAVVDGSAPDFPNVIATDGHGTVAAFQWAGHGGLLPMWRKGPSRDGFPRLTPPAVLPNGLLALGCSDGELKLLDPATGEFLKPWPDLDAPIIGTPASFLRQIYVTTFDGHLAMVDSNGILKKKVNVGGQIKSSPMVTATHVFVASSNGLHSYDLMLTSDHKGYNSPAGVSSFAIAADGALYVVAGGKLNAYAKP
jgi:outer membrane protein assembly factor BamB